MGPPPDDLHGEGALKELFAKGGYMGSFGNLQRLDVDALALPPDGFVPVPFGQAGAEVRQEARRWLYSSYFAQ